MATAEVASVQSALQVEKIEEPIKVQETTTEEAPSVEPVADEPKDEVTEAEPEAQESEVAVQVESSGSVGLLYPKECEPSRNEYVKNCRVSWVNHFVLGNK